MSKQPRAPRRADGTRYYSPAQVSELTGIPTGTLAQWRHRKFMFPYTRIGSHVLYRREDIEQALEQHVIPASAVYA